MKFYTFLLQNDNIVPIVVTVEINESLSFYSNIFVKDIKECFYQNKSALPYRSFVFDCDEKIDLFSVIAFILFYESAYINLHQDILNKDIYIYGSFDKILGVFAASVLSYGSIFITSYNHLLEASLLMDHGLYYIQNNIIYLHNHISHRFQLHKRDNVSIPKSILIALVGRHTFFCEDLQYLKDNLSVFLKNIFLDLPFNHKIALSFSRSLYENICSLVSEYPIFFDNKNITDFSFLISDKLESDKKVFFISTDINNQVTLYTKILDLIQISDLHSVFKMQSNRYDGYDISSNEEINLNNMTYAAIGLRYSEIVVLNDLNQRFKLNESQYFNIIKVARTIADLDLSNFILKNHILESFGLCVLNK